MYKGFTESSQEGYVAKEFDKLAPAPGVNWDGQPEVWFGEALQRGWSVKTSPRSAKIGSIILGFDQSNNVWVGIVRDVNETGIRFDTLDQHNQQVQKTVDYESLVSEYKLIGYIWPEHMEKAKNKLIL